MGDNYILEIRNCRKEFPGVVALDNVCFNLKRGEIHALVGENGAGKSTIMKILAGIHSMDAGEIIFEGKKFEPRTPSEALEIGIYGASGAGFNPRNDSRGECICRT